MRESLGVYRSGIVDTAVLDTEARQALNVSIKAGLAGEDQKSLRQGRRAARLRREYYIRVGLGDVSREVVEVFEARKKII